MRLFIYFDRDVHVVFVLPQLPWSAQKRQHHKKQMARSSGLDTVTLICCPTSARLTDAGTRCWFARWFFFFFLCARARLPESNKTCMSRCDRSRHMPRKCERIKKRVCAARLPHLAWWALPYTLCRWRRRIATAQSECAHFPNICGSWP